MKKISVRKSRNKLFESHFLSTVLDEIDFMYIKLVCLTTSSLYDSSWLREYNSFILFQYELTFLVLPFDWTFILAKLDN